MKIQMTHEWQIYKIWHNYDRFMTFIWQIYDRYVRMIDLWQLYDGFLTDLWHFYANDSFMIVLWQIYDSFVKIVGPTLDKSTNHCYVGALQSILCFCQWHCMHRRSALPFMGMRLHTCIALIHFDAPCNPPSRTIWRNGVTWSSCPRSASQSVNPW